MKLFIELTESGKKKPKARKTRQTRHTKENFTSGPPQKNGHHAATGASVVFPPSFLVTKGSAHVVLQEQRSSLLFS